MPTKFVDSIKLKKGLVDAQLTVLSFNQEQYVAFYSPALDLYAYGDDEEDAKKSFEETLQLYMDHVLENKSLWADLKKRGWKKLISSKYRLQHPTYDPIKIMKSKGVSEFKVKDTTIQLQAS